MKTAERAWGALYGLAIGDALGMPTQMLSRAQIRDRWGDLLTGFEPAPPGHPIAAGRPAGASPDEAGATGDTNGAAMRIAPVGIAFPVPPCTPASVPPCTPATLGNLSMLADHVVAASRVTHNTGIALAGAAAVAAAVSAG